MAGWSTAAVICLSGSVVYCSIVPHRSLCRQPMATAYTHCHDRPNHCRLQSELARSAAQHVSVNKHEALGLERLVFM